jgi:hypothetical protein
VLRDEVQEGADLIVHDGPLPTGIHGPVLGFIKTPKRLPSCAMENFQLLSCLKNGERSPLFLRRRSGRDYYAWFISLKVPSRTDVALSTLALIETPDSNSFDLARQFADETASLLWRYAPRPYQDERAPQNLLPVGFLERTLRRQLGDRTWIQRLLLRELAKGDVLCLS